MVNKFSLLEGSVMIVIILDNVIT